MMENVGHRRKEYIAENWWEGRNEEFACMKTRVHPRCRESREGVDTYGKGQRKGGERDYEGS